MRKNTQQLEEDVRIPEKYGNEDEMITKSVTSEKEHTYEEEQIEKNSSFFVDDDTEYTTTELNEPEQKTDFVTTNQEKAVTENDEVVLEEQSDFDEKLNNDEKVPSDSGQVQLRHANHRENKQKEQVENPILKRKKSDNQEVGPKKGEIPFNVLMLPKDKQSSPKQTKRKSTNYDTPPIHLLSIPEKQQRTIQPG